MVDDKLKNDVNSLLRMARYHSKLPSEILADNQDKFCGVLAAIKKHLPVKFDIRDAIDILDDTFASRTSTSRSPFYSDYINNIQNANVKWVAIYPTDFANNIEYKKFKRTLALGNYSLVSPQNTSTNFKKTLKRCFNLSNVDTALLDHYNRQLGGFLLSNPQLCFLVEGSERLACNTSIGSFKYFRSIIDLYSAHINKRLPFIIVRETNRHFFLLNSSTGDIKRVPIKGGTKFNVAFNVDFMREFKRHKLARFLNIGLNDKNKLFDKLNNSLHFFSQAFNDDDAITRYLFYIIAIESLFSRDKNTPIRSTLADNVALLCFDKSQRMAKHRRLKEFYDLRSAIVHQGHHKIPVEILEEAEKIASLAILKCLMIYDSLAIKERTEESFFNWILKVKLDAA